MLAELFGRVTGEPPWMWGPSIVGYGSFHYRYASGHEGTAARIGFSPRKARHSLYLFGCGGEAGKVSFEVMLRRLGKHDRGAACIYVNKLTDIDLAVLEQMAAFSWNQSLMDWPEG